MRKLTKEEINAELAPRGIQMIGEYHGVNIKTLFRREECGHEWLATPSGIRSGRGCFECSGWKQFSAADIAERIAPRGLTLISEYKGTQRKGVFKCEHGHQWETYVSNVIHKNSGCPNCAGLVVTVEDIRQIIEPKGITMIGAFKGQLKKTEFRCECGHEWKAAPSSLVNAGTGCPKCAGNMRLTREKANAVLAAKGFPFVVIGEYRNNREHTRFKGLNCGHEFYSAFANISSGKGCPECGGRLKDREKINAVLAVRGIVMLSAYESAKTKARFYRIECGHEWETPPDGVLNGTGCPICAGLRQTRESINAELSARGIVLIDDYTGTHTKHRFVCSKDHVWHAYPAGVKRGSGCPVCANVGIWASPIGYVYVMAYGSGLTKIGISNAPYKRLRQLERAARDAVELIAVYQFGDGTGRAAWEAEQEAHDHFAEFNAGLNTFDGSTELFSITPAAACDYLRGAGGGVVELEEIELLYSLEAPDDWEED